MPENYGFLKRFTTDQFACQPQYDEKTKRLQEESDEWWRRYDERQSSEKKGADKRDYEKTGTDKRDDEKKSSEKKDPGKTGSEKKGSQRCRGAIGAP